MTITHNESEQGSDGGPDPLATVAELIVEHVTEGGTACGEGHRDAKPGTFAARVWVTLYRQRIERLDPEGRYSVKQSAPSSINLANFAALDDDTLF